MLENSLSVLLIEDNPDDERLALRALRTCGLNLSIDVARDGQEALRALGVDGVTPVDSAKTPQLVVCDLKLPKLNGDEVLQRAREDERLRSVPFVMFSSSDEQSDVERCLAYGASAYCRKPVAYEEYIECARGIAKLWLPGGEKITEPDCVLARSDKG